MPGDGDGAMNSPGAQPHGVASSRGTAGVTSSQAVEVPLGPRAGLPRCQVAWKDGGGSQAGAKAEHLGVLGGCCPVPQREDCVVRD